MSNRSIANQTSNARPADQRFAQAEMSKCFQQWDQNSRPMKTDHRHILAWHFPASIPSRATIGLPAKRHWMAFCWRAD